MTPALCAAPLALAAAHLLAGDTFTLALARRIAQAHRETPHPLNHHHPES